MRLLLALVATLALATSVDAQDVPVDSTPSLWRTLTPTLIVDGSLGAAWATGNWHHVEATADRLDAWITRPEGGRDWESWVQHAAMPAAACGGAMLVDRLLFGDWNRRSCVPAAVSIALMYWIREADNFGDLDSFMDAAAPTASTIILWRWAGWP